MYIYIYIYVCIYICICHSQSPNSSHPSFTLGIHVSVLFICVSMFALHRNCIIFIIIHLYHFSRFHMWAILCDTCFSLLDLSLSISWLIFNGSDVLVDYSPARKQKIVSSLDFLCQTLMAEDWVSLTLNSFSGDSDALLAIEDQKEDR